MRKLMNWRTAVLILPLLVVPGCILVPEIEDRIVQLAVAGSTTAAFTSTGETNTTNKTDVVDVNADINLTKILEDNGVDASDVKDIKLSGVSYRVTKPEVGRSIQNGVVTIQRGAGAVTPLVSAFTANVGSSTGWIQVNLNSAGVDLINAILADLLVIAKGGTPSGSTQVTYHVQGDSVDPSVPTNFAWEFKLDLSIMGEVKVQVVN